MKHLIFILMAFALCAGSCINIYVSNAPIEQRNIEITGSADAISVSHGIDVVVDATLAQNDVRITTHNDIIDYVKVYVEDSTLNIELDAPRPVSASKLEVRIPKFDYSTLALSGGAEFSDNGYRGKSLTIAASGGAEVDIDGEVDNLTVAASGGVELSLDELCVANANIEASGGAEVDVMVTTSLIINASGGADVSYNGNPMHVDISKSGGATVEHDND